MGGNSSGQGSCSARTAGPIYNILADFDPLTVRAALDAPFRQSSERTRWPLRHDRGFSSFENRGLIASPVAHMESLRRMGIKAGRLVHVRTFSEGRR